MPFSKEYKKFGPLANNMHNTVFDNIKPGVDLTNLRTGISGVRYF